MSEWKESCLADVVDLATGFPFKSSLYVENANGIRLLRGDNVVQGKLRWEGVKRWSDSDTNVDSRYKLQENDVVLAMDRPWIEAGLKYSAIRENDLPCYLVQRVARLRGTPDLDSRFLHYLIGSREFTEHVRSVETGTAVPHISSNQIKEFAFLLPPLPEQRAIAGVLSSLDDKIDLLHRQNKTLEALAETLFRQWFVEEANDDWAEGRLADIVDHIKVNVKPSEQPFATYLHYSLPAFDAGGQPVAELGEQILSNKYQVVAGSVLVSKLNPRFPRIWPVSHADTRAVCSTEFQVLKPKLSELFEFVYYFLRSSESSEQLTMAASGTSGSHQRVRPEEILSLSTTTTDQARMAEFSSNVRPLLAKTFDNRVQIRTLEKLRDTLLPKLMSGEVRVEYE